MRPFDDRRIEPDHVHQIFGEARTFTVPLSFLPRGRSYVAEVYADGPNAHWLTNPLPVAISRWVSATGRSTTMVSPPPGVSSAVSALSTFYQDSLDPFDEEQVEISTLRLLAKLPMPLFVKPLRSDASLGIGGKSLVHDAVALMERIMPALLTRVKQRLRKTIAIRLSLNRAANIGLSNR